ncbi:AraC family transcriptional regulator [Burkholderia sp. S-53]|uniref:AraC family transcriptional regulator n=1 Tax=Burkholderia sp. S-53 TaxID=2906514 RepID=UPI0021D103A3|nr:AraC family transcriptional regulator [Burkholderia sp. S-53]UXU85782.1 AraC family transcriptional regulator [Burkholderia sp. S-53]
MPKLIRSASLTHYAKVARASGLDPYRMLAEAGLPADSLTEVDLKIPAEKVALLLELSAQHSGVEAFGLRMAEGRRASNLGPLALYVRDEPTLRHALNAAARYSHLQNEAVFISVEEDANVAIIREELLAGEGVPVRQGTELALAVMFRLLRFFLGEEWRPKRVCFTHGAPADRAVHTRVFGPDVEFGHAFTGIVCDVRDLGLALPSADPVMGRYVRRYLGDIEGETGRRLSDDVRKLVFLLLPSGRSSIDHVARQLGMSRRTMHRHLAQENTTFSAILDTVRGELVLRYLERRERPFSEISGLLGFSEPSAFTRWFRTRFGCSPSQFKSESRIVRKKSRH